MQYIKRLSDRADATNLRYRIDWKIAFDLEIAGIHPTTQVYLRERHLANDRVSYAFEKVLEHLSSVVLVKRNAKQRILYKTARKKEATTKIYRCSSLHPTTASAKAN